MLTSICRSGLAWKYHIDVGAGVIDRDYRGNVGVVLFNFSQVDFDVHHGDRIAQLIIERISIPELEEVEVRNIKCFIKRSSVYMKQACSTTG